MKQRIFVYNLLLVLVGGATIGLDQWSKAAIRGHFGVCPSPADAYIPLIGQYFGLVYACNTGTAFSFFEHGQRVFLFVVIGVALAVIIWLYLRFANQASLLLKVSFGLVLGGAAGNLIDRFHRGSVTDFLLFRIPPVFSWPVFNLADSAIFVGICLLIFYFWRRPVQQPSAPAAPQPDSASVEPPAPNRSTSQV